MLSEYLIKNSRKTDTAFVIFIIAYSFLITLIFLQYFGQNMIYYDSYYNLENAISLSKGLQLEQRDYPTSTPFVILLSFLYQLFPDHESAFFFLRVINLMSTVLIAVFFYLIGRKMFNPIIALSGTIMALFMPILLANSGSLENNMFALAMGLGTFYFSIKPKRILDVILASVFLILCTTRFDTVLIFIVPYFIGLARFIGSKTRLNFAIVLPILIIGFFVPTFLLVQSIGGLYNNEYFEDSIIKQIQTLVTPQTIILILQSSFEITGDKAADIVGNDTLNSIYFFIISIGMIFFVFNFRKEILNFFKGKFNTISEASTCVIFLTIIILFSIFSLAAFHLNFLISDGTIAITDEVLPRYMMDLRIFLLFVFSYALSLVTILFLGLTRRIIGSDDSLQKQGSKQFIFSTSMLVNKSIILSYIFIAFLIIIFSASMWDSAIRFYENRETMILVYHQAASWLSENLEDEEFVMLPQRQVFQAIDPTLKNHSYDYTSIWRSLGYVVQAQTSENEIIHVREKLLDLIHDEKNNIKYIVIDWNDRRGTLATNIDHTTLNKQGQCEQFDKSLIEAKRFSFSLPHSDWKNTMIICEVHKNIN